MNSNIENPIVSYFVGFLVGIVFIIAVSAGPASAEKGSVPTALEVVRLKAEKDDANKAYWDRKMALFRVEKALKGSIEDEGLAVEALEDMARQKSLLNEAFERLAKANKDYDRALSAYLEANQ